MYSDKEDYKSCIKYVFNVEFIHSNHFSKFHILINIIVQLCPTESRTSKITLTLGCEAAPGHPLRRQCHVVYLLL